MDSKQWRNELKMKEEYHPLTQFPNFQGRGVSRTARVLDLLDCAYVQRCRQFNLPTARVAANLQVVEMRQTLVDVSQGHVRRPLNHVSGEARCLTTSSTLYYMHEDRVLCPKENLLLQGYDSCCRIPDSWTEADTRRIAGEGIALPALGLVVWTLFACHALQSP